MTVLCYHSVEARWVSPLTVDPHEFDRHCTWLRRHRRVLSLDELLPHRVHGGRSMRKAVALTFDDGFATLYEHALPVLQRHRLPATVFVVARTLVDNRPIDWVDPEPPTPQYALSSEQIHSMRELGITFGSHSFDHHDLTSLTEDECLRDLRRSREVLEDLLREPVRLLAYPYGRHAAHVRRAAERAGFDYALSLPERREAPGRFAVPRAGVYRGNGIGVIRAKASPRYVSWRTGRLYPLVAGLRGASAPAAKI